MHLLNFFHLIVGHLKGFILYFQNLLGFQERKKFYYKKQRQRAIFERVFMIFGHCQNHQNSTFKRPYQPNKSRFEKYFYAKINTTLLLYLYQIFIFLLGHLHFFLHFFFLFMKNLFKKHPISKKCHKAGAVMQTNWKANQPTDRPTY